ncbi:heterokaryon incompatibility protein-domain-containing protein [Ilyonectria sp. MPI-CAGE-AT-0026]|nr:heterokaryon incompatibility protein-domain-containing protein [Ilyonectria sp. MPI-CAGE-AT-0026]
MTFYKDYPLHYYDSVRLLTLHPDDNDAIIEVSVMTVRLSAKPDFLALSYTWGNPIDEQHPFYRAYEVVEYPILFAGKPFVIHQNLHEALWQMREKQEFSPFWIDAICIDQKNQEKRTHQPSLMPCIYHDASWVIIWLGKADGTTHEAVHCLDATRHSEEFIVSIMGREIPTQILNPISLQQRKSVALLFRRRWFNRIWTLQEVLFPERTRCFCGPYELDIGAACMLAALLLRIASSGRGTSNVIKDLDELPVTQLGGAAYVAAWEGLTRPAGGFGSRALLRYPEIDYRMKVPQTLKWLVALELFVHEARQQECSHQEDKVLAPLAFALHESFAPETPDFVSPEEKARRVIDCRIPVTELYLKFTRFMVESMSNLDILSRAHRDVLPNNTTKQLELPSWVPPFHEAGTTALLDDLLFIQYNAAIHLGPRRNGEDNQVILAQLLASTN